MVPLGGGRNFNIQIKALEMDRFDTSLVSWMSLLTYYRRIEWHGLVFKIWPSQEILKIRDGTPLEAEGILTYIKKPSKQIGLALL
ncbi:hypothetical protein OROMI_004628 [Orobanche minor]